MSFVLVDTSIWIEVFRARAPLDLEAHVAFDDVVTCLPVVHEVLQGIRDDHAYRIARDGLFRTARRRCVTTPRSFTSTATSRRWRVFPTCGSGR
jgi:predicted nucleic acid-binding protein